MNATNCTQSILAINSDEERLGWTTAPNYRGTMDIIWGCATTMFLCCWSVLVVNVPAPNPSKQQILLRKLCLVGLYAMAPELVFQVALGQWVSARQSIGLFHQLKDTDGIDCTDWTIRHGFYANMGGFRFKPAGWEKEKSFPIDAKQLHYLVKKRYVRYPEISTDHIRDKNKVDGMLRLITVVQTLWFVVNVIVRPVQGLTVTALELSTAAFVWLGFATSLCWMSKPADVQHADIITSDKSMEDILREGGDAASGVYYYTPLDFASRAEWSWSKLWSHGLNLLRRLHWVGARPPSVRPIPRFQNTVIPVIQGGYYVMWFIVSLVYFVIFFVGWNFNFPTRVECILWQSASTVALGSALVVCFTLNWCCSWYPGLRARYCLAQPDGTPRPRDTTRHRHEHHAWSVRWFYDLVAFFRNNSIMKDPALDTPPTLILITWVFGMLYVSARVYIVIADVIELRSLPLSAYKTVEWSSVWPHF